ncbi:MAG: hypothetical protein U0232_21210 [Thermomicrobiales bacterium]
MIELFLGLEAGQPTKPEERGRPLRAWRPPRLVVERSRGGDERWRIAWRRAGFFEGRPAAPKMPCRAPAFVADLEGNRIELMEIPRTRRSTARCPARPTERGTRSGAGIIWWGNGLVLLCAGLLF